jgi:hypothetical protein
LRDKYIHFEYRGFVVDSEFPPLAGLIDTSKNVRFFDAECFPEGINGCPHVRSADSRHDIEIIRVPILTVNARSKRPRNVERHAAFASCGG